MYQLLYWTILFKIACGFKRLKKNFFNFIKKTASPCLKEKVMPDVVVKELTSDDEDTALDESFRAISELLSQTELR